MQPPLLVDTSRAAVAVVAMDRPHRRNAGNLALWNGLRDAFAELSPQPLRLAVLTGSGGHFCAGNDIFDYGAIRNDLAAADAWMAAIREAYAAIRATPFPVIAAIDGTCAGAGCGLAMSCDFRVATRRARFAIPAARLGIMYPAEQTRRLASLVGIANARRWLYAGALRDAQSASADGFVDALVDGDAVEGALAFAAPFMESAPLSVAGAKRQLDALADGTFEQQRSLFERLYHEAENSADHAEAESAFAQKRPPRFTGR